MLDEAIKAKLSDPAYPELHMTSVNAIRKAGIVDWYDSHFIRRFEVARHYLSQVRPDALENFVRGFDVLLPPPGFQPTLIDDLFDDETKGQIRDAARTILPDWLKGEEMPDFGRHIVHDYPLLVDLQQRLLSRISGLVGRELMVGYNFLSLYGGAGKCEPHMDEPGSMFTLDYCIEQSAGWPTAFPDLSSLRVPQRGVANPVAPLLRHSRAGSAVRAVSRKWQGRLDLMLQ